MLAFLLSRRVIGLLVLSILGALVGALYFFAPGIIGYIQEVRRPTGQAIAVELPGGATMDMVWIGRGSFLMGSPADEPGRDQNEGPQHRVTISRGFYLGKYEITQVQWTSVMHARPWTRKSHVEENPHHPAVYISWEMCGNSRVVSTGWPGRKCTPPHGRGVGSTPAALAQRRRGPLGRTITP